MSYSKVGVSSEADTRVFGNIFYENKGVFLIKRVAYENTVTVCWIMGDPTKRIRRGKCDSNLCRSEFCK